MPPKNHERPFSEQPRSDKRFMVDFGTPTKPGHGYRSRRGANNEMDGWMGGAERERERIGKNSKRIERDASRANTSCRSLLLLQMRVQKRSARTPELE